MVKYKPEDYELITTMWYILRYEDGPSYNSLKYQVDDPEDGIGENLVTSLTTGPNDPNGSWSCMGNDFSLSKIFTNIEPRNPRSCITKQYRKRSYLISVPNGELSTEGFYYDKKNTPIGAIDNVVYNVSSGSGIFEDAKIIHITVDNDGSIFGQKWGRRVEVFKLKPKQKEDIPPNIIGIFNKPLFLYGNLNGEIIPLENPLELQETIEFKQNGKFVELIVLSKPDNPNIPNRNNLIGVWEQQYDKFLDFTGWRLIIADSINDNGVYSIYITNMENNIVTEYKYIYQESGYQEGNPLQTPLVMYGDCTRITFQGIGQNEGY